MQERFCYHCNGDHTGTECPVRYPKSEDEEIHILVSWLDTQIKNMKDNEVFGKNYLMWLRSVVHNRHYK